MNMKRKLKCLFGCAQTMIGTKEINSVTVEEGAQKAQAAMRELAGEQAKGHAVSGREWQGRTGWERSRRERQLADSPKQLDATTFGVTICLLCRLNRGRHQHHVQRMSPMGCRQRN